MRAEPLAQERHVLEEDAFAEIVIWRVPQALKGSSHALTYRLALVVGGQCVLRYDNEAGKGDHRHLSDVESPYALSDVETLLADLWTGVDAWRRTR